MKRMTWWTCLAIAALALVGPIRNDAAAQGRQLSIQMFDVTYDVGTDGVIHVEERITFRFDGSWNGVYRWIPFKYQLRVCIWV